MNPTTLSGKYIENLVEALRMKRLKSRLPAGDTSTEEVPESDDINVEDLAQLLEAAPQEGGGEVEVQNITVNPEEEEEDEEVK